MGKFCMNCGSVGVNEHHILHKSQGGEGTYVQTLCSGSGLCHNAIESATRDAAENFFANNTSATGSSPTIVGSKSINGRYVFQRVQETENAGSLLNYSYDGSVADLLIFNADGTFADKGQITKTGSCSFMATGSPTPNHTIIIISSIWNI